MLLFLSFILQIWDRLFTGWLPADSQPKATTSGNGDSGDGSKAKVPLTARLNGGSFSGSASGSLHPWSIGINPAYLVSFCVAIVVSLREALLACREFATAMDILQAGLVILNGDNNSSPGQSPGSRMGTGTSKYAGSENNFFLSQFLQTAKDIYANHALPYFRSTEARMLVDPFVCLRHASTLYCVSQLSIVVIISPNDLS